MNVRALIVVPLALVCGLSAMFLVQAIRKPVAAPTVARTPVVFAVEDVKTGEMVTEKGVEIRQVPTEDVPEDAIRVVTDAVDRAAKSTIDKGDMLRVLKLAEKGAGRGMAALIKPGMRAFTIQTPSFSSSLAGFLLPGNKVDVLLTATPSPGSGEDPSFVSTTTLLQGVEILAVHTNVSTPTANKINPDDARSVTLSVTPEDALKLDQGQNRGTLHLSLRNPTDKEIVAPKQVVSTAKLAPVPVVVPESPKLDVHAGGTVTIVLARTLRGTQAGAETLKVRVSKDEPLNQLAVTTPYGVFRLDRSMTVEADPGAPVGSGPFGESKLQLTSKGIDARN